MAIVTMEVRDVLQRQITRKWYIIGAGVKFLQI